MVARIDGDADYLAEQPVVRQVPGPERIHLVVRGGRRRRAVRRGGRFFNRLPAAAQRDQSRENPDEHMDGAPPLHGRVSFLPVPAL